MVWRVEHGIATGKAVVKRSWSLQAKGLAKGQGALSVVVTAGAALFLQSVVKGVWGFVGFAACEAFWVLSNNGGLCRQTGLLPKEAAEGCGEVKRR